MKYTRLLLTYLLSSYLMISSTGITAKQEQIAVNDKALDSPESKDMTFEVSSEGQGVIKVHFNPAETVSDSYLVGEAAAAKLMKQDWIQRESFLKRLAPQQPGLFDAASFGGGDSSTNTPELSVIPDSAEVDFSAIQMFAGTMHQPAKSPYLQSMMSSTPLESFATDAFTAYNSRQPYLFRSWDETAPNLKHATVTKLVTSGAGINESADATFLSLGGEVTNALDNFFAAGTSAGSGNTGNAINPFYADPSGGHVVRYTCCDDVLVYDAPAADAAVVATLNKNELLYVVDILPSTGLDSGMDQIDEQNQTCSQNPSSCNDVVSELSDFSNIQYYAKVYRPATKETGFTHLQALFKRPIGYENDSVTLEISYQKMAEAIATALQPVVNPANCSDTSWSINVSAGSQSMIYHPTSQTATNCPQYTACPDWKLSSCEDVSSTLLDEGCYYQDVSECAGLVPDREPSNSNYMCIRNSCIHKGTCQACSAWFEATGQDVTGWQTTEQLVHQCVLKKYADAGMDINAPCEPEAAEIFGGCLPFPCNGDCYAQCYFDVSLQTENASSCKRYIDSHDSRSFPDNKDYECGEIPQGATHPDMWQYPATGEWNGSLDYNQKEFARIDILGKTGIFKMDRLPGQRNFDASIKNLTSQSTETVHFPDTLELENFWFAFDREDSFAFTNQKRDVLWIRACAEIPGVNLYGPNLEYDLSDELTIPTKDGNKSLPRGLIKRLDFGNASVDSMKICGLGGFWMDDLDTPRFEWAEVNPIARGLDIDDLHIEHGPTVWGAALVSMAAGPIGKILGGVLLSEMAVVQAVEGIINQDAFAEQEFYAAFYQQFSRRLSDKMLKMLEAPTREAVENQQLKIHERLENACNKLHPNVGPGHPYYYFYKFMHDQCEKAIDPQNFQGTESDLDYIETTEWFTKNNASTQRGCYGNYGYMMSPEDADSDPWWGKYQGQSWWEYTDDIPDQGCRLGTRIAVDDLDPAFWPVLKCSVANVNYYVHNGLFWYIPPDQHKDSMTAPDVDAPTHYELVEQLGELNYMISKGCEPFGRAALLDLYGDGEDLVALYKAKHPEGIDDFKFDPKPSPDEPDWSGSLLSR